jgi:predicted amidophosphoribosyltransferase
LIGAKQRPVAAVPQDTSGMSGALAALFDLVLPAACAGCGSPGSAAPLCTDCVAALCGVTPQRVRPDPEPPGLPRTYALAAYGGALRSALLDYKEHGRHGLAAPLGDRLAAVVLRGLRGGSGPVLLVPVPATAAAARRRHGDHIRRLAERAARVLRRGGVPAGVTDALRALPRADSTELSAAERAIAAQTAFAIRSRRGAAVRCAAACGVEVVLVDDIITTGATIAAASGRLGGVSFAAVLAATQRRAAVLHRT